MDTVILITGGTGNVGSELVRLLLERGAEIRLLARDPGKVRVEGAEVVGGDLSKPETLAPALAGVDHAFLLSSYLPDQYALHANLIEVSRRLGGIHIVEMCAIGTTHDSPIALLRRFARAEDLLKASGLDWTILEPHMFMQNLLGSAGTIAADGVFYSCTGDGRMAAVDTRDIAAVAAVALTEPGHAGKTYVVTGPEAVSQADMARTISGVLGREVRYVDVPNESFRETMLGFGLTAEQADDITMLYGEIFAAGGGAAVSSAVPDVTGRPARSFEQFVRDHADAFRA